MAGCFVHCLGHIYCIVHKVANSSLFAELLHLFDAAEADQVEGLTDGSFKKLKKNLKKKSGLGSGAHRWVLVCVCV